MDTIVRLESMPCRFWVNFMIHGASRRTHVDQDMSCLKFGVASWLV